MEEILLSDTAFYIVFFGMAAFIGYELIKAIAAFARASKLEFKRFRKAKHPRLFALAFLIAAFGVVDFFLYHAANQDNPFTGEKPTVADHSVLPHYYLDPDTPKSDVTLWLVSLLAVAIGIIGYGKTNMDDEAESGE